MKSELATTAREGGRGATPVMRPPRPGEANAALSPKRRRPFLRSLFFSAAAVGGFIAGEIVLLALADDGTLLPSSQTDRLIAFGAALGVALLGGLLCAAMYRHLVHRR